jgi:hypothetical protein
MRSWPLSLRLGIGLLVVGTGPLLVFVLLDDLGMISDPNPNPVGLGLLSFVTIPLAVILSVFGLLRLAVSRK